MSTGEAPFRLRPGFYSRPDFFVTDIVKGTTRTATGTRVCALTNDFLIGFRDALIYETGKSYRKVMKRCGRRWGEQFAKRFEKEIGNYFKASLSELSAGTVHTYLVEAFNYHGYGLLKINLTYLEQGIIVAELAHSMMPSIVSSSDRPVDMLMAGFLGAIFSYLSGQDLDAIQTACPTQGAESSLFVIAASPWIAETETWLLKAPPHTVVAHETILKRMLGETLPGELTGSAPVEATS